MTTAPPGEVVIEIPRGSFLKRGSTGSIDFVSPLPCPFKYGSVPDYLGLERRSAGRGGLGAAPASGGARVSAWAFGAVGMADRGLYDDKLSCSRAAFTARQGTLVTAFFRFYGWNKRLLNLLRGRPGRTAFVGWVEAGDAIARARPFLPGEWEGPNVPF